MLILEEIKAACAAQISLTPEAATRFFKVSAGSYGENDRFLGVTVPVLRKLSCTYGDVERGVIAGLLQSPYNEERLLGLFILVGQYQKSEGRQKEERYQFYLDHLDAVNNWNLVDASAHLILGHYLWDKDKTLLLELSGSPQLWRRRVAIVATWYFIRQNALDWTFRIAHILKHDAHDLIHKAVGWMLREAGKKDETRLIEYLREQAFDMPKTMLRYALERLSLDQKTAILRSFQK